MNFNPLKIFKKTTNKDETTKRQATTGVVYNPYTINLSELTTPSFKVYRLMKSNPTISLARAVATIPIKTSDWILSKDEDVPDDIYEWVDNQINWLKDKVLDDCLLALDYGFQAFEKIYELKDGTWFITRLKPLLPDITSILTDDYGNYVGVKQSDIYLPVEKTLLYTYDGEHGNLMGRSRHENIREFAFIPWVELNIRQLIYAKKASGTAGFVGYEAGTFLDTDGNEITGEDSAKIVAQAIQDGKISYGPIASKDSMNSTGLSTIDVKFVDSGSNVGNEFNEMLK